MPQVKVSKNPSVNWRNDAIQFPRLIAELEATGALTDHIIARVGEEMDLAPGDVLAIIDRAQYVWDDIKRRTPLAAKLQ